MKANSGKPCGDGSSRKKTGRCVHAAVVALYVHARCKSGLGVEELELEHDGEMGGMEVAPEGGVWGNEGVIDVDKGFVSHTQAKDPVLFAQRISELRMIESVYRFPVVEPDVKEGTYGRGRLHVNACGCTGCGQPYSQLNDGDATLLGQWVMVLHSSAPSVPYL